MNKIKILGNKISKTQFLVMKNFFTKSMFISTFLNFFQKPLLFQTFVYFFFRFSDFVAALILFQVVRILKINFNNQLTTTSYIISTGKK